MIIYLFLILILYFLIKKNILFKKNKEHFYTLFNPYTVKNDKFTYKYDELNNINILITSNLHNTYNNYLTNFLIYYLKLSIANNSSSYNIILNYSYNERDILEQIYSTYSIGYVSYPTLYNFMDNRLQNKIRFIMNTNNHYLIPISNTYDFNSLKNIKNKMPIVIDNPISSSHTVLEKMFKYFNKKENIDYVYIYKTNIKDILESLINKEYTLCFISISFPSKEFTKIVNSYYNKLYILDYEDLNLNSFINSYFYLNMKPFNLSNVTNTYLPHKIRDKNYTIYKPHIQLINYEYLLIGNKDIKDEKVYALCKDYYDNINNINNLDEFKENKLTILNSFNLGNNNLFIQDGSEKFMNDIGIITTESNPNCINFVTKAKCNKENLEKYNFNL